MWGNLADRLGATDINATLEKIGNAVAPREDDDDCFDDEDGSDGDYDDDYYDEDASSGNGGNGVMNKVTSASPFRLAGILTDALDSRRSEIGNINGSFYNSHTNEINTQDNKTQFPTEPPRIDEVVVKYDDKKNDIADTHDIEDTKQRGTTSQRLDKMMKVESQTLKINDRESYGELQIGSDNEEIATKKTSFTGLQPAFVSSECVDNISEASQVATRTHVLKEGKVEGTPFDKSRNETKLPLIQKGMKTKMESSVMKNDVDEVNTVNADQVSTTRKSLKRNNEICVGINSPISLQALDRKVSQSIPTRDHDVSSPIDTGNETKEDEKMEFKNEDMRKGNDLPLVDDELPSIDETNGTSNTFGSQEKSLPKVIGKDCVSATVDTKSNILKSKFEGSSGKQAKKLEEVTKLSKRTISERSVQSEINDADLRNVIESSSTKPSTTIIETSDDETSSHIASRKSLEQQTMEVDSDNTKLKSQLVAAKQEIQALQNQAERNKQISHAEREDLIAQFHSKETRLLQATSEENHNQSLLLHQEYSTKIQNLENSLAKERNESQQEQTEYKRLLRESYSKSDQMENQLKTTASKYGKEIAQVQQREERALRKVDDRMAQTMAVLDERDDEIKRLKKSIKSMESKVNEHQEGEEEAEEELEELHQENESLRQTIEKFELEKTDMKIQVATLKSGSEELSRLQMELTMLKEERIRERTKSKAVMESALSSRTQLETERDNALSELRDSKQQLAATLGDLGVSRSDYSRMITANGNLQSALEAFQDERRAEIQMIDEQRRESEEAMESAHTTATSALKQTHANEIYELQKASDDAVKNVMHEMQLVECNLEKLKSENFQTRRSLDEAIHRLQTTQEDVIDRNVMKNILLDWCTINDNGKRRQVLQVIANLLHFSDDEKEKVHLTSKSLDSVRAKVVGALAAPLPPSKADVEHLEGSNVHEKWVNFLMAETDDA